MFMIGPSSGIQSHHRDRINYIIDHKEESKTVNSGCNLVPCRQTQNARQPLEAMRLIDFRQSGRVRTSSGRRRAPGNPMPRRGQTTGVHRISAPRPRRLLRSSFRLPDLGAGGYMAPRPRSPWLSSYGPPIFPHRRFFRATLGTPSTRHHLGHHPGIIPGGAGRRPTSPVHHPAPPP